jgi:hypothetical protein
MSSRPEPDAQREPAALPLKYASVVLVCGDCESRSSGPIKLRAKDVRKQLKHDLGHARFKMRVLETSCLGLCPKKALAMAAIGVETVPLAVEVRRSSDVAAFAARIVRDPRSSRSTSSDLKGKHS